MQTALQNQQTARRPSGSIPLWLVLAATVLTALAGCASPAKETATAKPSDKEGAYVYYTPTGSNIPVRVRKSEIQSTDRQATSDQNALRAIQQKSGRPDKQPGGQ